ncbi:hypothetical protein PspKH34_22700 [Parageobacillus sp. KH3-4]|nr:hypothetical protein PspKH34_22700 [Parageobacillus sp. KH3-4]
MHFWKNENQIGKESNQCENISVALTDMFFRRMTIISAFKVNKTASAKNWPVGKFL